MNDPYGGEAEALTREFNLPHGGGDHIEADVARRGLSVEKSFRIDEDPANQQAVKLLDRSGRAVAEATGEHPRHVLLAFSGNRFFSQGR